MTAHRRVSLVISLVFLAAVLPPVFAVLGAGFASGSTAEWAAQARSVLGRDGTWRSLRFSILQAAVSAGISVLVALPGAYLITHYRFRGRQIIQSLSLVPFVMPSLIVILAVIGFYGRAGVLGQVFGGTYTFVYSGIGIVIAHTMFNISVALRIIAGGWMQVDERYRWVSASLGEGPLSRLMHLHLPLITPSLTSAFIIVFLYCFVSFGVVLVFGGVRYATLEVRIFQEMFTNLNLTAAGVLAALQLAVAGVLVSLVQFLTRRSGAGTVSHGRQFHTRSWGELARPARLLAAAYWVAVGLFLFAPFLTVVLRAFTRNGQLSLTSFRSLLGGTVGTREVSEIMQARLPDILSTSLGIAGLSALTCASLAYLCARSLRDHMPGMLDTVLTMPLAISGVTLSLGLRLLLFGLVPEFLLIILAQSIMAFPLVFRNMRGHLRALPTRYLETGRSLGARPLHLLITVEIPVLWRGLVNAFAFAFAVSLADFTSVLTIGRGRIVTFPIAMYRLIGFQSFDVALALGVMYMAFVGMVFFVVDITSVQREGAGL
ncbi:MAG: ABC transporter permease [Spirochaetota bacterium]